MIRSSTICLFAALAAALVTAPLTTAAAAPARGLDQDLPYNGLFFGLAFSADTFKQYRVRQGRDIAMRFRAERTGAVTHVSINNRVGRPGEEGVYHSGDGGRILVELRTDDGTIRHLPSDTVLGKTHTFIPTEEGQFVHPEFESPVRIEGGRLYHLIVRQLASDWASMNQMTLRNCIDPPGGPYYGYDFMTFQLSGDEWRRTTHAGSPDPCVLPYASLKYSDGVWVGAGGGWSHPRNTSAFGDTVRVRQRFTAPDPTPTVNGVWMRLARQRGTTAPLAVELKDEGGDLIHRVDVPASEFAEGDRGDRATHAVAAHWVHVPLPSATRLTGDAVYFLELTSSGAYAIQAPINPVGYRYHGDRNTWSDARAEISRDGGRSWTGWQQCTSSPTGGDQRCVVSVNHDLPFLFTLEGGPKAVRSIAGPEGLTGGRSGTAPAADVSWAPFEGAGTNRAAASHPEIGRPDGGAAVR